VGAHVDGHTVDESRKIGAVVEIEAADQILVSLAFAAVDRDDKARNGLEQLSAR
jgi:hypothetical protein